jgi:Hg(II)-responsive transcriptional regulator
MNTLTRGQLARLCGVGIEAIRFYENQGLLQQPARSASGYRRYPHSTVQRLQFIRRAKDLGFSLKEIGELLALHDDEHSDRAQVKALADSKLDEIGRRIRDLQRIQTVLSQLAEECSGAGPISGCPIIDALAKDEEHEHPTTSLPSPSKISGHG